MSRSPLKTTDVGSDLETDIEAHINAVLETTPISEQRLIQIKAETVNDPNLQTAIKYTKHGWPEHQKNLPQVMQDLFASRTELSVVDGLLVHGVRIVIPPSLRPEILDIIHEGHFGVNKCKERAQTTVWWPGIGKDMERKVVEC